jgi:hypothetical protein
MNKYQCRALTLVVALIAACWTVGGAKYLPFADASLRGAAMFSLLLVIVAATAVAMNMIDEA